MWARVPLAAIFSRVFVQLQMWKKNYKKFPSNNNSFHILRLYYQQIQPFSARKSSAPTDNGNIDNGNLAFLHNEHPGGN